jgi:hypothetical protein
MHIFGHGLLIQFSLNGKYEVQGAEEPAAFLQVFDEIKSDTRLRGTTGGGNSC